jgi:hypothetical protein
MSKRPMKIIRVFADMTEPLERECPMCRSISVDWDIDPMQNRRILSMKVPNRERFCCEIGMNKCMKCSLVFFSEIFLRNEA